MTLKEIARRANVSVSTVSRVINSKDNNFASVEVRNRIWDIVQETGYVANVHAKMLKTKSAVSSTEQTDMNLACFLARTRRDDENPFFAEMVRAFEQQALRMGYHVPYVFTFFDPNNKSLMKRVLNTDAKGAVIMGRFNKNGIGEIVRKHYKKVVFIGLNETSDSFDQIISDGYSAGCTAMEHLIELGHTNIAYIGEIRKESRFFAYCNKLREYGIPYKQSLVGICDHNGSEGYYAIQTIYDTLNENPTAVYCANDITAMAVIDYCTDNKISVPDDLSIISIDDVTKSAFMTPMLTTVRLPKEEMGRFGAKILIERLNGEHQLPMKIIFPHKLIVRDTTVKLKK